MKFSIRNVADEDEPSIRSIFNHYIENSYAAFPEERVGPQFLDIMKNMTQGYPFYVITDDSGEVIGFGFLHRYHPFPVFSRAAEVTYFISPEYARKGLGTELLSKLVEAARGLGIETLLASISSLNEASMSFHSRNGFKICGRFEKIGKKNGKDFDVVWMQLFI
ncbi:MAG TPA: GNAT family N-acetyltransferase [Methanotrichaceae archaeon]|nr:GNAT family N-acetyltransferase [Methanotrichaceae archaeon]